MKILLFLMLPLFLYAGTIEHDSKIYIAGHRGLVGSALVQKFEREGCHNLITRSHSDLDLTDRDAVDRFFQEEKPEYVVLAAAKVGGIVANMTYPVEFIRDNLLIELNVIDASFKYGVKKLLFLGSSCIYPRMSPQPIQEESLLSGPLEETNRPYALAKIAGLELCRSYNREYGTCFISCMPTNLYGPGDNFDLQTSHVIPGLIARFVGAKKRGDPHVVCWGTGTPMREFLYIDDLANACYFLLQEYESSEIINVGVGHDISIKDLVILIKEKVGYEGDVVFDSSKPDGTPKKLLDTTKINSLGWYPEISLEDGLERTIDWYRKNYFQIAKSHGSAK